MPLNPPPAFQDEYPDALAHCYGCGRLNQHGHQIKSYWEENGQYSVCRFQPEPYHTAVPGYVYGGLLASLVDCHATGTASAAARMAPPPATGAASAAARMAPPPATGAASAAARMAPPPATGAASAAARMAPPPAAAPQDTPRFLTASLNVDFLKPTPLGPVLELRGWVSEIKGRKVVVDVGVFANGVQTVRGKVVCVQATPELLSQLGIEI